MAEKEFIVKVNIVLIRGFNDNEIVEFIKLTEGLPIAIRFIEFMPFDGNAWDYSKTVSLKEILNTVETHFNKENIIVLQNESNDTTKNYKIKGFKGRFGVISTISNPFCDSCNRIRLTANGYLKNCLFSSTEFNVLEPLRRGEDLKGIISNSLAAKFKTRGGMDTQEKIRDVKSHQKNRNMTVIGG